MRLLPLVLGLFLSQTLFAKDLFKVTDCWHHALTVKETTQTRSFDDNQIQFILGQKKRVKADPVDVLVITYGNNCRMMAGILETDLKEAVPVAIPKLNQYTVTLDVGMSWNEGYIIRKVIVTIDKNIRTEANAIKISVSKLP